MDEDGANQSDIESLVVGGLLGAGSRLKEMDSIDAFGD
jgi:hypothetical protein